MRCSRARLAIAQPKYDCPDPVNLWGTTFGTAAHEGAGGELGQQLPVQAALVEQVDATQVSVRVTQPIPPDQSRGLGAREGGAGGIDRPNASCMK